MKLALALIAAILCIVAVSAQNKKLIVKAWNEVNHCSQNEPFFAAVRETALCMPIGDNSVAFSCDGTSGNITQSTFGNQACSGIPSVSSLYVKPCDNATFPGETGPKSISLMCDNIPEKKAEDHTLDMFFNVTCAAHEVFGRVSVKNDQCVFAETNFIKVTSCKGGEAKANLYAITDKNCAGPSQELTITASGQCTPFGKRGIKIQCGTSSAASTAVLSLGVLVFAALSALLL